MPSVWLRILSYLYPVPIRKSGSDINPRLELYFYRGTYQLGTPEAMYSSGKTYEPIIKALSRIKSVWLKDVKEVLLLGTGLASAVHILDAKKLYPKVKMVDVDSLVLDWAMEFLPNPTRGNVIPVQADALQFIREDKDYYELIIVDVFIGRKVPAPITEFPFLKQCKERLLPDGKLILNFIVEKKGDDFRLKGTLERLFEKVDEVGFGENRVFVAGPPSPSATADKKGGHKGRPYDE
jgi:spermidine synthase